MSTKPTVCIVESLGFLEEQTLREGNVISRTLQMSGKRSPYVYVKNVEELKSAAREFGASKHRYLHLSSHGSINSKDEMKGLALTTEVVSNADLAKILAPHLKGRRLFLSSCLAGKSDFPDRLMEVSECRSILAPMNDIGFDDAAVFWIAFYHLMFKSRPKAMSNTRIKQIVGTCAALVNERFRLFIPGGKGTIERVTIGPPKKVSPTFE